MTNLPKNWTETTLNDVAEYINGRAFKPSEWETEGVPIVRIQNLNDYNAPFNYSTKSYEDIFKIKNGDLLFAWAASLGAYIWQGETAWLNQHIFKIIPKIDKDFLFYSLSFKVKELYSKSHGSGMVHITKGAFLEALIPLPPLAEQERIVAKIEELFAGIDAGVENLKSVKNQIALYRQSVLKSAFNIKNAVIQKASEIGEVSLGRQRSPKNISKFYPTKYIRAANISENGIDVSDILDMEFLPYEKEKYLLKQNDILLSEASGSPNQVGKPAIWNNEIDDCCFQNTVIRHRLFSNHPKYVFWFYKYLYLSSFFAKLAGGVGINHIGSTKFSNIEIPIPSLDEQKRIVAEIESRFKRADALETAVDRALNDAEKLKQAVLKKAFSGELVPQNPDDEPASVLLDRIRAARASELPAKKGKRKKTEVDSQL